MWVGQYATVTWKPLAPIEVNGTKFSVELSNKTFGGGLGGLSSKQAIVTATVKQIGSGYAFSPRSWRHSHALGIGIPCDHVCSEETPGLTRNKVSLRSAHSIEPIHRATQGLIEAPSQP